MSKREQLKKLREGTKKVSILEENEKNNPLDAFIPPIENENNEGEEKQTVNICDTHTQETQTINMNDKHTQEAQAESIDNTHVQETQTEDVENTHTQDEQAVSIDNTQSQEIQEEDVENFQSQGTQTENTSLKGLIKVDKKEAKSQRINFLLKPSVHKESKKVCKEIGISLNDLVGQLLEAFVNDYKNK